MQKLTLKLFLKISFKAVLRVYFAILVFLAILIFIVTIAYLFGSQWVEFLPETNILYAGIIFSIFICLTFPIILFIYYIQYQVARLLIHLGLTGRNWLNSAPYLISGVIYLLVSTLIIWIFGINPFLDHVLFIKYIGLSVLGYYIYGYLIWAEILEKIPDKYKGDLEGPDFDF